MEALLVINHYLPVRTKGESPLISGGNYEINPISYNYKGQLLTFKYNNIDYIYISEINYSNSDRKLKGIKNGYCKLTEYELYKKNNILEDFLNAVNWFDEFEFAKIDDLFKIEKVEFEKSLTNSYSKYFILIQYEFKITSLKIDFANTLQYPKENTDVNSPVYCKIMKTDYDAPPFSYSTIDEGNFFTKNFKNKISALDISNSSKQLMYEGIIKICFRIDIIFKKILDVLAIEKLQNILAFVKNIPASVDSHNYIDETNTDTQISTIYFTRADKTIAHLLVDWGYKDLANTKDFALEINGDQFYGGLYKPFENYYNALVNLYQNISGRSEVDLFKAPATLPSSWDIGTLNDQDNRRFQYLSLILPSSAISLLTVDQRIDLISNYINLQSGDLSTEAQDNVLKIMHSFYLVPEDGQKFLDFLLKKKDTRHTNFERLFNKFNDDNIRQISPVVGFFANEKTNRRNFIYGLYKIWDKTNYNFNYIPNGNPDSLGLNPDSFFYTNEGKVYFLENENKVRNIALDFGTIWQGIGIGTGETQTIASIEKKYAPPKIESEKISSSFQYIDVEKTINSNQEVINTTANVGMNSIFPSRIEFHLYQPITLVGYKVEQELEPTFPTKPYIPAFLWYYADEFKRLKDFNSSISFAIDVTIEVGLFFLTGGVSTLAELRYLRYASDLAKAIKKGTGAAEYTVLVLKGIGSLGQVVTVGSAVCERYYDLLIKLNDPNNHYTAEEKAYYEYLHKFFLNMTLITAGITVAVEYGVRKYAMRLTQDAVKFDKLDAEIKNLVGNIAGLETAVLNTFRNSKLTNKPKILAKFDSTDWSIIKRKKFYEDFKILDEADLLKLNDDIAIANWENLLSNNITDRAIVSIVTNTAKTNTIISYYNVYRIRIILSQLKQNERWMFLNGFDEADYIAFIKSDYTKAGRWENLNPQGKNFSVDNPEKWLYRFDREYKNLAKANRLSDSEILQRFGQSGLDLVKEVEAFSIQHISSAGKNQLKYRDILISGMKDKSTGRSSGFFSNFTTREIELGEYKNYLDKMFPNLKKRIDDIWAFDKNNYNMIDHRFLENTGKYPGAHAEIRALNDLAKKKFPNYTINPPSDEIFNNWLKNDVLGYNRNVQKGAGQQNVIMHTCADCFHILDLVIFIKP